MAKLLPSSPDTSAVEASEPRVIGVDSEDADEMLSALSSSTARKLLSALHEDPDSPSSLADRLDTSLQNVQYHLGKLEAADLVTVADTVYSEKGREMKVYAPSNRPLVVFAGREEDSTGLKAALKRLLGGLGILGFGSLIAQYLLTDGPWFGLASTGSGDAATTESVQVAADTAATTSAATTLPPGVVFFLGGALVLCLAFAVWYVRR
ncbi:Helix-turn-helix domain-containing protein [Halogranum amylolyticum]|uniref:Helix-turn-helix domain-containing protein n=1 Tax=Halogranum amylolyticum TaxID=660520 RepID=A0A1H8SXQ8_9EURY|nr:winged helix-turn-helix domain-containing protein [Halogranum amylolyticum]SEO83128.1 Helix-turn-helix domain-containing protein [Halogranum amylolyticum]